MSDPGVCVQSAAALCIAVGSFSDPEDLAGLAHFLEHSESVCVSLLSVIVIMRLCSIGFLVCMFVCLSVIQHVCRHFYTAKPVWLWLGTPGNFTVLPV